MKKKILWIVGILVVSLVLIVGIMRYIDVQKRENDPNWQRAKEIYKVGNALKEVDADYECQSVAKVTPFPYTDSEGNTIVYYCIQTAYLENESGGNINNAILYITSNQAVYPLPMYIRNFLNQSPIALAERNQELLSHWDNVKMSYVLFSIIPILLVYPFSFRYLKNGVSMGAVKG